MAKIEYVIAISIDGGRGDFIEELTRTAPEEFPNLALLRSLSSHTFNARCDVNYSLTVPNHLSMLTGRAVSHSSETSHGYTNNTSTESTTVHNAGLYPGQYKASVFDVVHDRRLSTALYMNKQTLQLCHTSWDARNGAPVYMTRKIDAYTNGPGSNVSFLRYQIRSSTLRNFTFLHIVELDNAGHGSIAGWSLEPGSSYRNAMRTVDWYIGEILVALMGNTALNGRWALVLTADHGGGSPVNTHLDPTHIENVTVPFFIVAPGLPPGSNLYDSLENRFDPGTTIPGYGDAVPQPIRNGDLANICTALFGLPPVPGSYFRPEFKKPLGIESTENSAEAMVSWPRHLTGYTLEYAQDPSAEVWDMITDGIEETSLLNTHRFSTTGTSGFFRLRSPEDTLLPPAPAAAAPRKQGTASTRKKARAAARRH